MFRRKHGLAGCTGWCKCARPDGRWQGSLNGGLAKAGQPSAMARLLAPAPRGVDTRAAFRAIGAQVEASEGVAAPIREVRPARER